MKFRTLGVTILTVLTMLFAGCRTAPVHNISDAPFTAPPKTTNPQQIADAIVKAGHSLGWIMTKKEPGHIVGTLHIRTHTAIVDVYYNSTTYSIKYKNSTNLKYDGKNIHSNYNGWVQNLANAIDKNVSSL